jgi:hypothetical protein
MRRLLLIPVAALAVLGAGGSVAQAATIVVGPPTIDTAITGGPLDGSVTEDETPTFSFTATKNGEPLATANFFCALDGEAPQPCASPYELPELDEEGAHTFSVAAEDPATATRDSTPATRSFVWTEEEAAEECEAGEELEDEEGEVEECEAATSEGAPPRECVLRTARARLFVYADHEKVRLVVRYTAYAPTEVDVAYRVSSAKGSAKLGEARAHFAKHGLFRATEKLGKAEMAKVHAAKHFTVQLDVPAAPSFCRRYQTRHLTARRAVHGQAVWFQSDSVFGGS